ncbi:MAG: carbohydrate kinase family protein [Lentisphaerae bacterium]|nr:carbohydrate kinase family protein [Lentisphaerota bacterium]MBQ4329223.1 carbohydrate kinase family protein [Lentisphaeria bacterium]
MKKGIIGAGNWIQDRVKTIDRWPGEGNLCNVLKEEAAPGGGPANVLFDLNAADPSFPLYAAGRIGMDAEGDYMLNEITRRGIDAKYMLRTPGRTSYTDVMSGEGKRTFFHCRGANAELCYDDLCNIDAPAKYFYLAYLLLLDTLDSPDPVYGTQAVHLLKTMQEKGYETVVDFVSEAPEKFRAKVLPALPYIDHLIVNEVETACCSGEALRDENGKLLWEKLPAAVKFLFDSGVKKTVVIHFPEGACAGLPDGTYLYVPSFYIDRADIVGSNGAGDAFCAGVLYGLHENWDLKKCLTLGGAFSNFNLHSATASGGAVELEKMLKFMENAPLSPLPEGMA